MGVKVREKPKGSGVYWIFINQNKKRTSRRVGSKEAAEKVRKTIEAKLTLGEAPLGTKPNVPTIEDYYNDVFKPVYLESAVRESTQASYRHNSKFTFCQRSERRGSMKSDTTRWKSLYPTL